MMVDGSACVAGEQQPSEKVKLHSPSPATHRAIRASIVVLVICKLSLCVGLWRPSNWRHFRLIGADMECAPPSSIGPRHGTASSTRVGGKFVSSTLLAAIALFAISTVTAHAQSNWTGAISSDWFARTGIVGNWLGGIPTQTTDANINTVTPNATVISDPGAQARNLTVGANGTGMLTIQNGGTLTDQFGTIGNLPGGLGTVTVTGPGASWTNVNDLVVGGQGTGTLIIQNGATAEDGSTASSTGGSIGQSAGSTGTVTVTGAGSSWINGPSGGLNVGSFGTGTLTIANGGNVIDITPLVSNIGTFAGSHGTVTVTGAGSLWSDIAGINIGRAGTGTLTITDGGIVIGPAFTFGASAGAIGPLIIGAGAGKPDGLHPARSMRRASHLAASAPAPARSTSITHPPTTCLRPRSAAAAPSMCSPAPPSQ